MQETLNTTGRKAKEILSRSILEDNGEWSFGTMNNTGRF
jgi:hypothetical protein